MAVSNINGTLISSLTSINGTATSSLSEINGQSITAGGATNLLNYTEEIDNAYWTKENLVITANDTTAPDSTVTADRLTDNSTNGRHRFYTVLSKAASPVDYTYSVYVKTDTIARFVVGIGYDDGSNGLYMVWDGVWAGGTDGSGFTLVANGYAADANGFTRYWVKVTTNSYASLTVDFNFQNSGGSLSYAGSGQGMWVWGLDLKQGHTLSAYIRKP